jgi:hypothetical protein
MHRGRELSVQKWEIAAAQMLEWQPTASLHLRNAFAADDP